MTGLKSYWQKLQLKSRAYKFSLGIVYLSLFIALFADLLAHDKPLVCQCEGQWRWPAFRQAGESLGWMNITHAFDYTTCTNKWMPLIPFNASTIDPNASGYSPPAESRSAQGYRHWLGTDALGRDVLAGIIHGTRYAWIIGLISTLLTAIPGILIGMTIGYWKNHKLRLSIRQIIGLIFIILLIAYEFYLVIIIDQIVIRIVLILILILLACAAYRILSNRRNSVSKKYPVPVDDMVMRGIDFFESFPRLFLLMALLVFLARPSLGLLIVLIAFIRWPLFAQVARAEARRESELNYVLASENIGLPWYKIIVVHVWPNIKSALFTTALFSISTAILLEASLSFIGLGLKLERVTWGSILNEGRQYLPAWWLSFFPGLAIFILLISLHWILAEKSQKDGPREGW